MHLAEKVRLLRAKAGLSQREVASRIGTTHATLSRIENQDGIKVSGTILSGLARVFSVSVDDLVDDTLTAGALLAKVEGKPGDSRKKKTELEKIPLKDLIQIPVLAYVPSGMTAEIPEDVVMGHIHLPFAWVRDREAFAVVAKGDSMTGHGINEGDYVVTSRNLEVQDGSLALIEFNGEVAVKKVFYRGDQVMLSPSNGGSAPILVTDKDEFRIVGKVVFTGRRTE